MGAMAIDWGPWLSIRNPARARPLQSHGRRGYAPGVFQEPGDAWICGQGGPPGVTSGTSDFGGDGTYVLNLHDQLAGVRGAAQQGRRKFPSRSRIHRACGRQTGRSWLEPWLEPVAPAEDPLMAGFDRF